MEKIEEKYRTILRKRQREFKKQIMNPWVPLEYYPTIYTDRP